VYKVPTPQALKPEDKWRVAQIHAATAPKTLDD